MLDPQRYLEPRPRWRAALWGGALLLLGASGWFASSAWENRRLAQSHEEATTQLRRALQPKSKAAPSRSELELQRRWISLEAERNFAWYPVLRALEAVSSDDIELLEFSPDKPARRLALRGEARDTASLFAYVRALAEQPAFSQVYLARQKNKLAGTLTTVEFELRAQLN